MLLGTAGSGVLVLNVGTWARTPTAIGSEVGSPEAKAVWVAVTTFRR